MYDPALGRWHVQDPLMEYHFNTTPYHYVFNNPLRFIDPFGLDTAGVTPPPPLPGVTIIGKTGGNNFTNWWQSLPGIQFWGSESSNANSPGRPVNRDTKVWYFDYSQFIEWLSPTIRNNKYKRPGPKKPSKAKGKFYEKLVEHTSDKKIVENNTGTTENTTNRGEPVSQLEQRVKQNGRDSLPITCTKIPSYYKDGFYSSDKNGKRHGPFKVGDTIRWEYYEDGEETGDFRMHKK